MVPDPSFSVNQSDIAVGMAGTFDVENYGDLLFPLIAAESLQQRDPRIRVVPFSVNSKAASSWPFQVRSVQELTASIAALSAMLIGGGQIIRFDGRYPTDVPTDVSMPIAYWLVPAVLAALNGKPVIWNAPGAWTDSPRAPWHDQLLRQVFASSYFIGLRDAASRDYIAKLAPDAVTERLPDTAFGLSRLWPLEKESVEFTNWRRLLELEGDYVVVQPSAAVAMYHSAIESLLESMDPEGMTRTVILPISWCHGDRAEQFPKMRRRMYLSHQWLAPRLISEIVGRSKLVFASSLHACITALSYGVPVARAPVFSDRKYELLDEFEGIMPINEIEGLGRLIHRGCRIEPRAVECSDRLERYWNKVAEVAVHPPAEHCNRSRTLMLDWVAEACGKQGDFGLTRRLAMNVRTSLAGHFPNKRIALRRRLFSLKNLFVSSSPPANRSARQLASVSDAENPIGNEMVPFHTNGHGTGDLKAWTEAVLNIARIAAHEMETEPYQWAFIDELFCREAAVALASSFPTDKFKRVKGYDGEKGYEYISRSLVHMGASVPSHVEGLSPVWKALASDLLSPEYRSALAQISGRDLTAALMEVNVVQYGPGAFMGPHLDLKEKMVTHVLYFNEVWDPQQGGCINILKSSNPDDVLAEIPPVVGNSVLLVRSNQSWHSVSRVSRDCRRSRRSVNVIFHLPGSISTMWPPGEKPDLRPYAPTF